MEVHRSPQDSSSVLQSGMIGCLEIMASNSKKNHSMGLQEGRSESGMALITIRFCGIVI